MAASSGSQWLWLVVVLMLLLLVMLLVLLSLAVAMLLWHLLDGQPVVNESALGGRLVDLGRAHDFVVIMHVESARARISWLGLVRLCLLAGGLGWW